MKVQEEFRTWQNEEYHEFWNVPSRKYLHRMEIKILDHLLLGGDCFLDIGGGFGRLMPSYIGKYKKIIICDLSISMLKGAQKTIGKNMINHVVLVVANVLALPFKKNVFDAGIMIRVLHHIENPDKAIYEIFSILRNGSQFVLEFQNKRNWILRIKNIIFQKKFDLNSAEPILLNRLYWNFHPNTISTIVGNYFTVRKQIGGGIFWQRNILTKYIPNLEWFDLQLGRYLANWQVTHQIFLDLCTRHKDNVV